MNEIHKKIADVSISFFSRNNVYYSPFFYTILNNFNFIERDDVETAGVSVSKGNLTFYYNKSFFDKLPQEEVFGVIIHEIYHIITLTFTRMNGRILRPWNISTDVINNYDIGKSNFGGQVKIPELAVFLEAFTNNPRQRSLLSKEKDKSFVEYVISNPYSGKIIAEDFYEYLLKMGEDLTDNLKTIDDHSGLNDLDKVSEERIKNIIEDAKALGFGNASGELVEKIKELTKPKLRWKQELKNLTNKLALSHNPLFQEPSWSKVNRRGVALPGKKYTSTPLQIWVDSSGSLWNSENFKTFFTEIDNLTKGIDEVYIGIADINVKYFSKYKNGDWRKIKIKGGGGTDFACVFDFIEEKKMTKLPILFITDGEFEHNIDYKNCNITWALFNSRLEKMPIGKTIKMEI